MTPYLLGVATPIVIVLIVYLAYCWATGRSP